jgi:hypothetical protein
MSWNRCRNDGDVRARDHGRGARGHDREHEDEEQLTTKTILSRLHQLEDAPWGDLNADGQPTGSAAHD